MIRFWVPGKFPSLNEAFRLARESGVLAATHKARGMRGRPRDPFNDEARRVMDRVLLAARAAGWRPAPAGTSKVDEPQKSVGVLVYGHTRWDLQSSSAWVYKLTVDALFGGKSDHEVDGEVAVVPRGLDFPPGGVGLLVTVYG